MALRFRACLAAIVILFGGLGGECRADTFMPADGKTLLVVGQDRETIDQYVQATDTVPAGFMLYTSVQSMDGLEEAAPDRGAGVHDAKYLLEHYPRAVLQVGLYMVGALEGIVAGEYDDNIGKLGDWLKKIGGPVYLRIGYEFDFPENGYDPKKYQEAYRYIVDHLRNKGVTNAAYVWHSYGIVDALHPFTDWYPGDEYVDWYGVSYFTPSPGNLQIIANQARQHGKPLMIAEATPFGLDTAGGEETWEKWFRPLFDFIDKEDVKMLCYINSDWPSLPMFQGQGWTDARIQTSPYVLKQWIEATGRERFLNATVNILLENEP